MLDISLATICKFLYRSEFTRQRLHLVATQQDAFLESNIVLASFATISPDDCRGWISHCDNMHYIELPVCPFLLSPLH